MQWVVNTYVTNLVWAGLATEWIDIAFAYWTFLKDFEITFIMEIYVNLYVTSLVWAGFVTG